MAKETIERALLAWDGKSTDELESLYRRFGEDCDFEQTLLLLARRRETDVGSTWLVKHAIEQGTTFSAATLGKLAEDLSRLTHWQSRLHVLQIFHHLPLSDDTAESLMRLLHTWLSDSNKLIRAWSYQGMAVIARQYPSYKRKVDELISLAKQSESASVLARIRAIEKQGL